ERSVSGSAGRGEGVADGVQQRRPRLRQAGLVQVGWRWVRVRDREHHLELARLRAAQVHENALPLDQPIENTVLRLVDAADLHRLLTARDPGAHASLEVDQAARGNRMRETDVEHVSAALVKKLP